MSSLTLFLAALAITTSNLIRPRGRATLLEDVKSNIQVFSPYQSAASVIAQIIDLLNWRLTNIAEIHASLWAFARFQFYNPETRSIPSELSHGLLGTCTRRIFLVGVALPLCLCLLASSCHWVIKMSTTFLLAEAAMIEVAAWYLKMSCAGVAFRADWPQRPIFAKRFFASGPCPGSHVERSSETAAFPDSNENGYEDCPPTEGENLCDLVRRVWSPTARPNKEMPEPHPLENVPDLVHLASPTGPVLTPWTCGHWRCLLYTLLRVPVRALCYSIVIFDFALAGWFLQDNTHAFLTRISRILLAVRLLRDLLTLIFLFTLLYSMTIITNIVFVVGVPWMLRTSSCLQQVKHRLENLGVEIPSLLKTISRYGVLCLSFFISHKIVQPLISRGPILTESILSYFIELLMMPLIALLAYRKVFFAPRSNTLKQDVTQPHLDPELAPSDLLSTDKKDEMGQSGEDKSIRDPRTGGFTLSWPIFRLAVLLPNAAIWALRWWVVNAA